MVRVEGSQQSAAHLLSPILSPSLTIALLGWGYYGSDHGGREGEGGYFPKDGGGAALAGQKCHPTCPLGGLEAQMKPLQHPAPISPGISLQLQISPSPKCSMPNRTSA